MSTSRASAEEASTLDLREKMIDLRTHLAASEARFWGVVQRSSDGVLVVDDQGIVRFANPAAAAMLHRSRDDLVGHNLGLAVVAGDSTELELVRPGEEVIYTEMRVVDSEWEGEPCRLALLRDVTARHGEVAELARRATHDQLTGLPNRYLLDDRLGQALARLGRGGGSLGLFLADLDGFKAINDRYGHLAGDEVLIESARRIRSVLRPADTAARLGGDEFVLVCESLNALEARSLVKRLEAAFSEPMPISGMGIPVGLSVGFVIATSGNTTPEELIEAADEAMYGAKRNHERPALVELVEEEPLLRGNAPYRFTLYVAGTGSHSARAEQCLRLLCEQRLAAGRYEISVVDVLSDVAGADAARILVTPTVVRTFPSPSLRVAGDLSAEGQVADALGFPVLAAGAVR